MTVDAQQGLAFTKALFEPSDYVMLRPTEVWDEGGRRRSLVDYKGIRYMLPGSRTDDGWGWLENSIIGSLQQAIARTAPTRCNLFFGVCPRHAKDHFERSWQIRTVRVLWSDVDDCTVEESLQRCEKAGLPRPSIVVNSGHGSHLYWRLAEPYLIDDAGDPPRVEVDWIEKEGEEKKVRREWFKDPATGEKVYLAPQNVPPLSPKAQAVQDTLSGLAEAIGGDHTTDLARILRVPGSLNRKNERNGRPPVPCELVECDPARRYLFSDFAKLADASPARRDRDRAAKIVLPKPRKLNQKRSDKLADLVNDCAAADVGARSEADFALCCWAIENGVSIDDVWTAAAHVGKFAERGRAYLEMTWQAAAGHTQEKIFRAARQKAAKKAEAANCSTSEEPERPAIYAGVDESRIVNEAIRALAGLGTVYQRGGALVHVVRDATPPKGLQRPKDAPRIVGISQPRLQELLSDAADWFQPCSENPEEAKPIHPPKWAVQAVEARGQWQGIRPLEGVVEVPALRADGTILQTPGYDLATGLIYMPRGTFPEIPERPTKADAEKARDALLEVVADFCFASQVSKAAWLAAVLTPVARAAYSGPTPLFAIEANGAGVGKGLLVKTTTAIACGREPSLMTVPKGDDEFRKRITAIALAAEPIVLLDNVAGELGSPSLDAALTSTTWCDRVLGGSVMTPNLPLLTVWFATGNNLVYVGDTYRRVLPIRLESRVENPEERTGFQHPDLLAWVSQERPRLAAAALTILSAYCAAGRPNMKLNPWGSFEGWSDLIRHAVVWIGLSDPYTVRKGMATEANREGDLLRRLLVGWEEADPTGDGMTVSEALKLLSEAPKQFEILRAAIAEMGAKGKEPSAISIGMKLRHQRGRVAGGRFFEGTPSDKGTVWAAKRCNQPGTTETTETNSSLLKTGDILSQKGNEMGEDCTGSCSPCSPCRAEPATPPLSNGNGHCLHLAGDLEYRDGVSRCRKCGKVFSANGHAQRQDGEEEYALGGF